MDALLTAAGARFRRYAAAVPLPVLLLVACKAPPTPEPAPALPTAAVVNERFVDCTADVTGDYASSGVWVPYLTRRRTYDEWGNVALDESEDAQGARLTSAATFSGRWQLTRDYVDTFGSPVVDEHDVWHWDGDVLLDRESVWNGVEALTTYTTASDAPYERAVLDRERDGRTDLVTELEWADGRVVAEAADDGGDGSVERTWAYRYDADGHLVQRDYDEVSGAYDHLEQEYGGPHDNLLSSLREVSDGVGIPTFTYQEVDWTEDWTGAVTTIYVDGELFEIDTNLYDAQGRLELWQREFPTGVYTSVRESWTWECP